MRNKKTPGQYLLRIPINLLISAAIAALGFYIDSCIFSGGAPEGGGHGMPIFSVLMLLAAALWFIISTVVLLIKAAAAGRDSSREEN